ncbi:MAG: hypothetical protein EON57_16170 [Alphaproteobacteria bacterium]|nr:MAG: hypothetical protein EON57_16170 [Alphaproteobacteria bacterium]
MSKRMSKTLAAEIADRTLAVLNPQNRIVALGAALQRHGFPGAVAPPDGTFTDRAALISWLQATYATKD